MSNMMIYTDTLNCIEDKLIDEGKDGFELFWVI